MKLDLNEIAHSIGMQYTYEVNDDEEDFADSDLVLDEPVTGVLRFSNTGRLLLARGHLKTMVDLQCVRCLAHFSSSQEFDVEEQFLLHPERAAGEREPDDDFEDEDLEVSQGLYDDGILDLRELIRQNILVSLPIAPLCGDDCRGLCRQCGKNLNEGPCECGEEEPEGPMSQLKEMLDAWQRG